jgi:tRNA(Ile)-lysidine synthase
MSEIIQHISENWKHLKSKKIFLACSGGVDSMTLLSIFHSLNFDLEVLHVNYNLRGDDSVLDKELVENTCQKLNIPFHLLDIQLQQQLDEFGGNLQEVARNVRYDFFEKFRTKSENNYIALGHHLDDQIETFFMHIARKSGIMGMACMKAENKRFIRPLLSFSKDSIIEFANSNSIEWREDYSNKKNKYKRNILRNILLPELIKSIPTLKESVFHLTTIFQENQGFIEEKISTITEDIKKKHVLSFEVFDSLINEERIELLRQLNQKPGLLIDFEKIRNSQKGKNIRLEKNDDCPFISISREENCFVFETDNQQINLPKILIKKVSSLPLEFSKNEIYIDSTKIIGELNLRKWQNGDRMQPIGLKGSKLLSDIIKDAKIPTFKKKDILVLSDQETIIWCVGIRISSTHIADYQTKEILKITLQNIQE